MTTQTQTQRYYIISTTYAGPNPQQHLDDDRIGISIEPGRTNQSREIVTDGWLGQTNDWSRRAHGEYATLEDAIEAVERLWPERREEEYEPEYEYDFDTGERVQVIVAAWRPGRYALIPIEGIDYADWVSAYSTDAEIREAAEELEAMANSEDCSYAAGIDGLVERLTQERADLIADAERDAENAE